MNFFAFDSVHLRRHDRGLRTPWTADPSLPAERAKPETIKKGVGSEAVLQLGLKLNPHFLANVQSLVNKMDELLLRITLHKQIMECNIMLFTETWLNNTNNVPSSTIVLEG